MIKIETLQWSPLKIIYWTFKLLEKETCVQPEKKINNKYFFCSITIGWTLSIFGGDVSRTRYPGTIFTEMPTYKKKNWWRCLITANWIYSSSFSKFPKRLELNPQLQNHSEGSNFISSSSEIPDSSHEMCSAPNVCSPDL